MRRITFLDKKAKLLDARPLVVGTLMGRGNLNNQIRMATSNPIDLLELRLDTFSLPSEISLAILTSRKILFHIKKAIRLPILLTLRSSKESGGSRPRPKGLSDHWRWYLLKELIPMVDLVDVEMGSGPLVKKVSQLSHQHKVNVIVSFHDFKRTPKLSFLKKIEAKARKGRADILKAAITPHSEVELRSFLRWGSSVKSPRVILVGMGPLGFISRILGFTFGSIFTYGHLGNSAAPGQMPARKLSQSIHEIYAS